MPLALPDADPTRLEKSPLEVVVCQIRYENAPQAAEGVTALAVHETLGGAEGPYPNIDQAETRTVNFVIATGQVPAAEQAAGPPSWRFASKDGGWTVSLTPDFIALETTRYTTWIGDFRDRLAAVVDAVAAHVRPVLSPRIGVRYIDRIAELDLRSPADWEPYITPELLGPTRHPTLGPGVRQAQQQLLIELDDEIACTLRHGFVPEGERLDYLMDFDVFREAGRPFDAEDVKRTVDTLNDYSLRLFHTCVTPALLEKLR
jgi:uncharacterized protein (TIGR04255 family)